ncbi:MAG: hypothetical protein PHE89_00520 [Alphaproteobacteria bacterium]|nr:hypothetical protein [Alphaproteobacteria bacterium]
MKTKMFSLKSYSNNIASGQKDEALVISNEDNILVLKLKEINITFELDYSNEQLIEQKFQNLLGSFCEGDIVYVRITKKHGIIQEVLPSEMYLTYEYESSKKIVSHLEGLATRLASVLDYKDDIRPETVKAVREEIFHAENNIKKFSKRMAIAKKLLERYKVPKVKRSYKKKCNAQYYEKNRRPLSVA